MVNLQESCNNVGYVQYNGHLHAHMVITYSKSALHGECKKILCREKRSSVKTVLR